MSGLAGDRALPICLFLFVVVGCLFVAMVTSPDLNDATDDFYIERSGARTLRQGLALTGDFVSAAGVFYFCGVIAVAGYDGILLIAAAALSPLLLKVWLAERLPSGPGWSLGDVFARRLPAGSARRAAGIATLVASLPLLIAQLVPIGKITAVLIGLPGENGEMAGIALVGVLMVACTAIGGVRGSTLLQIGKVLAFVLIGPLLILLILTQFGWNYGEVLQQAVQRSGVGDDYLAPGQLFGTSLTGRLDTFSLALTVLMGTAFLPHLVMRLSTAPTAESARRAMSWAVIASCLLCVTAAVVGYGTQALVGAGELKEAGPHGGNNLLLLAAALDGSDPNNPGSPGTLLTFVSCAAFLAVLASASVLLLAASAAIVHDMGRDRNSPAGHSPSQGHGHARVRRVLVAVGLVCIALAVLGRGAGAQFWLTLTYTEAATAVLPALAYSLLWRGFTVRGLRWCVYGGTLVALVLLAFSPAVSGSPDALLPGADWSVFPLYSPGLVSIPAAFLLGAIGSRSARTPERPAPAPREESAVAAGAGAAGTPAQ